MIGVKEKEGVAVLTLACKCGHFHPKYPWGGDLRCFIVRNDYDCELIIARNDYFTKGASETKKIILIS